MATRLLQAPKSTELSHRQLLTLATFCPMTAQNQSATEWVAAFVLNHVQGKMMLRNSFERVRNLAVKHYVSNKDLTCAKFVTEMPPNLDDLADLIALQKFKDGADRTDTSLEKVIQKYIVKASSGAADSHAK